MADPFRESAVRERESEREAALAADFKAYHRSGGTRRPEETGKGETRMGK